MVLKKYISIGYMDKRVYFKTLHNIKRHNQIIPKFKSVNCNLVAQKKEMRFFFIEKGDEPRVF